MLPAGPAEPPRFRIGCCIGGNRWDDAQLPVTPLGTSALSKPERFNFSSGDWFAGTVEGCQSEATSYNAYSGPFQVDEDKQTEPPRGRARVALEDAAAVSRPQQTGHRQLHGSFGGSLPNYCTTEMGPK